MSILGKGRAAAVSDDDLARLAIDLGCHPAVLGAISIVESSGFGWAKDGRMKILNEKHWFYKLLKGGQRTEAVKMGLARKNWISPRNGGYKEQNTTDKKYRILAKSIAINEDAAFQSISMGKFQIMGFNHKICGFSSAKKMFDAFTDTEVNQLKALSNFLIAKRLQNALKNEDFERIEQVYNGGGLNGKYAARMRTHCRKLKAGKWKDFDPAKYGLGEPAINERPIEIVEAPQEKTMTNKGNAALVGAGGAAVVAAVTFWDRVQLWFAGWF
jgi:hypothetical protein